MSRDYNTNLKINSGLRMLKNNGNCLGILCSNCPLGDVYPNNRLCHHKSESDKNAAIYEYLTRYIDDDVIFETIL